MKRSLNTNVQEDTISQLQTGPNETATDRRELSIVSLIQRLKKLLKRRPPQFWIAAVLLAILSVVTFVVIFTLPNLVSPTPVPPTPGRDDNLGNDIQIIQRHEWGAREPINITKFEKPVKMVRILHTAGAYCQDYPTCADSVLGLQVMQMSTQGMPDLAYNYMIGGDGNVYLGRGPDVQNEWQRNAIDIGYIGNFLTLFDTMTDKMDLAGRKLVAKLRKEGYLTSDYVVIGHNQTYNTLSPGENIYKKIVKWPHYDNGLYYE